MKFLPETSFDRPDAKTREELYKSIYRYKEEDILSACEKARQEGFQQGSLEAKNSLEASTHQVSLKIKEDLENLRHEEKDRGDALFLNALTIAQTITHKLLPVWAKQNGLEEIKAVIEEALEITRRQSEVEIWVHPDVVSKLQDSLEESFSLHGDDKLSLMDCRVEWKTGGFEKIMKNIWEDVDKVLNAYTNEATVKPSFEKEELEEENVG